MATETPSGQQWQLRSTLSLYIPLESEDFLWNPTTHAMHDLRYTAYRKKSYKLIDKRKNLVFKQQPFMGASYEEQNTAHTQRESQHHNQSQKRAIAQQQQPPGHYTPTNQTLRHSVKPVATLTATPSGLQAMITQLYQLYSAFDHYFPIIWNRAFFLPFVLSD